jgi:uncharacterized protein YyaL (SSP411 family)
VLITRFADDDRGLFMVAKDVPHLITRPKDIYDGALPSGNSMAAYVLTKLFSLTGQTRYRDAATAIFDHFYPMVRQAPHAYAYYGMALELSQAPVVEVSLKGALDASTIAHLQKVLYKRFIPALAVKWTPNQGPWQVTVCHQGTCSLPLGSVPDVDQLFAQKGL